MSALEELPSAPPTKGTQQYEENLKALHKLRAKLSASSLTDNEDEAENDDEFESVNADTNKLSLNDNMSSNTSGLGGSIVSPTSQYDHTSSYSMDYIGSSGGRSSTSRAQASRFARDFFNESLEEQELEPRCHDQQHGRDDSPSSTRSAASSSGEDRQHHAAGAFSSLPLGLAAALAAQQQHTGMPDFDPFTDYTDDMVEKQAQQIMMSESSSSGKRQMAANQQLDQHLLAQAIAAAIQTSSSGNEKPMSQNNASNQRSTSSSVLESIEKLSSKYKQHQAQQQQQHQQLDGSSLNSLLLAMAASGLGGNSNSPDFLNTPQLKRQSAGAYLGSLPQSAANMLFSTPISAQNNDTSPSSSNTNLNNNQSRLNSTPNMGSYNQNTGPSSGSMMNEHQSNNRYFRGGLNSSMPTSSSAYNLSSPSSNHTGQHHHDSSPNNNTHNSSMYEDDDVFSSNSSYSSSNQANQNNGSNLNGQDLFNLYRTLLLRSNLSPANINEMLANQSFNNLSNMSMGSDGVLNTNNSANFMNMSSNGNNNANVSALLSQLNQFKGNSNNFGGSNSGGLSPIAAAAALLKQQQKQSMGGNQRMGNSASLQSSPMMNQSSNIAALTSATNNMASLLSASSQQQQYDVNKRRVNSVASSAFNFPNSNSGQNQSTNLLTHNAGPNATMLLQNSSLASSARINLNSSSTASVLGSNSALTQTLNALQQQNNSNYGHSSNGSGHNLLSALSLSSSNPNAKPLRSERLPPHMVEEIIKQAKIRRKQGGKKEVCVFCRNNSEKEQFYTSHTLKDASNNVACPILRLYQCPICHATGDQAHTIKYCPYAEKDSAYIKLFKDSNKMSAAAALFMNSLTGNGAGAGSGLNGTNTPPSPSSPSDTPSPISQQAPPNLINQGNNQLSFLNSPQVSSPNPTSAAHLSLVQALTNFQNGSLNKSYGGAATNANLLAANLFNNSSSNNSILNKSN